jgi:hypothetical protein
VDWRPRPRLWSGVHGGGGVGSYLQASQVLRWLICTSFGRRIVIPKFFLIFCVLV